MLPLDISTTTKPSATELQTLFDQTTWARGRSTDDVEALLATLQVFVAVRESGRVVGFGRAISDGVYRALVEDVVVDGSARGKGIGMLIMSSLMEQLSSVEEVFLHTREDLEPFYARHDFVPFRGLTMKQSKRPAGERVR